jgi:hypothetical protein
MRFSIIAATILPLAMAMPAELALVDRQATVCSGTTGNAQCCATDVLGLVDLNCANRTFSTPLYIFRNTTDTMNTAPSTPTNKATFVSICSAIGQQALCCALPVVCLAFSILIISQC